MAEYEYTVGDDETTGFVIRMTNQKEQLFFLKQLFANANLSEDTMTEEEIKNVVVRIVWSGHRDCGLHLPHDKGTELLGMLQSRHKKTKNSAIYELVSQ